MQLIRLDLGVGVVGIQCSENKILNEKQNNVEDNSYITNNNNTYIDNNSYIHVIHAIHVNMYF